MKAIKLSQDKGFTLEQAGDLINFANKVTSRGELLAEGGYQKVYDQVLGLVGGNKQAADKAMEGIEQTLNLPGLGKTTYIRQQITPPALASKNINPKSLQIGNDKDENSKIREQQLNDTEDFYNDIFDFGDPNKKDEYENYVDDMLNPENTHEEKESEQKESEQKTPEPKPTENEEKDIEDFYNDIFDFGNDDQE